MITKRRTSRRGRVESFQCTSGKGLHKLQRSKRSQNMISNEELGSVSGAMDDRLPRFLHWMEENGVKLQGCTLKPCEEISAAGLGVYTTDGHPVESVLMATPLSLAITPMTALQDALLGPVFAKLFEDGDVDDRLVVMLYLLVEDLRGDSSFWAPYLKMLPRTFGMTLHYTEEELLELKGTSLHRATILQNNGLRHHFYEKVKGLAETILTSVGWAGREVVFENFLWANCIFWTRALNVPFPHSLVIPKVLPEWPEGRDGTAIAEGSGQPSGDLEMGGNKPQVPLEHLAFGRSKGVNRQDDNSGEDGFVNKVSLQYAFKAREASNSNEPSVDLGATGGPEAEATVWVEALVPGIDFCNHSSQAGALWEVDDEKGSLSGVEHSMYLITAPGIELPSSTEVVINYGNKGNEELLYLYGFVLDNNPDDYLMLHYPKEALEHGACLEEKSLLLEEQRLSLRWLLSLSLLKEGYVSQQSERDSQKAENFKEKQFSHNYSYSGHRKPPQDLERQVFPEDCMAALRIIAMSEEEVQNTTALLEELLESHSERIPTAEDIRAAVWEVCGNAGALQLLQDLLTSKLLEIEEGTGPEDVDTDLLEKDARAQMEAAKRKQLGSVYVGDEEFIQKNLMSKNKRACVVYRKGQKLLARFFLQEAEYALKLWIP